MVMSFRDVFEPGLACTLTSVTPLRVAPEVGLGMAMLGFVSTWVLALALCPAGWEALVPVTLRTDCGAPGALGETLNVKSDVEAPGVSVGELKEAVTPAGSPATAPLNKTGSAAPAVTSPLMTKVWLVPGTRTALGGDNRRCQSSCGSSCTNSAAECVACPVAWTTRTPSRKSGPSASEETVRLAVPPALSEEWSKPASRPGGSWVTERRSG